MRRPARNPRSPRVPSALLLVLVVTSGGATIGHGAPPAPHLAPSRANVVETTFNSVDAVVAGQWEFPESTPAPLVVILPASTNVDRHGLPKGADVEPGDGIYAQLAARLLREGFAVFRFDSPGTGRSGRGRFSTERSTALEAYTRAVDHARVDTSRVFLLGHSGSTDAIVGIYPRYEAANPLGGVVLLSNRVGETDLLRVEAPVLIVVTDKNPDDLYQHGRFPTDARSRAEDRDLPTTLVTIPDAEHSLLTETGEGVDKRYAFDPRAVTALLEWLGRRSAGAGMALR